MQILFTSDLHLGHEFAARCRGFDNVHDHDNSVIATLEKYCTKRSILWILGDVAMKKESLYMLGALPGRLKLVRGNHDNYPIKEYLQFFEDIYGFLMYKHFWLSHCPIHPQEMYRAKANIHGHIHKNTNSPELPLPYFNVNWDFHKKPITLEEIKSVV